MRFYLAPMEGVTGYIYRNAVRDFFGDGVDKYFTPFFAPHTKRTLNSSEIRDILPENNEGIHLVPQILTISAEDFFRFEEDVKAFGYNELNINFGCPSGTVASKGRGAGFLADPGKMEEFLDRVFDGTSCRISVKTRLGIRDPEEFYALLELYNKYPMEELIVHFRVKEEMYRGKAHRELWQYAGENCLVPLVYNGDVTGDKASVPEGAEAVMLGRGFIGDPAAIGKLKGTRGPVTKEELKAFFKRLETDYSQIMYGEVPVLHKLKEIWSYMQVLYRQPFVTQEEEVFYARILKDLFKSKSMEQYRVYFRKLMSTRSG